MKGVVYRIHGLMGVVYVGSTTSFLLRRAHHKHDTFVKTTPLYTFMRDNGGWEAFKIEVIEEVEYTDKVELYQRERFYIEDLKPLHNRRLPSQTNAERSRKQYRNNPKVKEYKKQYYEQNKERIQQSVNEWQTKNKERFRELQKKWRERHPNYMKDYMKKYTKRNKDETV